MKEKEDGSLAPVPGYLTQQIKDLAEAEHDDCPHITVIEYNPLIDSACMGPSDWSKLATDIEKNYLHYETI